MSDFAKVEQSLREEMTRIASSFFQRGYATGSAGNLSLLLPDGNLLATPTGSCLGNLDPQRLSKVAADGEWLSGDKPSKEVLFHLALYRNNPRCKAVVHLHSTWSTALSCLQGLDSSNVIRPFTPYVVMRMGNIPLVPYYRPGDNASHRIWRNWQQTIRLFYWQIMAQWFVVKACKKPPTIWKSWRKRQS